MSPTPKLWQQDGFFLSTDKTHLDVDVIHDYLHHESYWSAGIPREAVEQFIRETPFCFGLFDGDPRSGSAGQIGFARVITDFTTFAYLADVFVLPPYRGRGLSKWMMGVIMEQPELQVRSFLLVTRDAHGLYARYGFAPLPEPGECMRLRREGAYGLLTEGNLPLE